METAENGRVELSGRWFGVRGRRFVRPSLTVTQGEDGREKRWLAELEHKPWAAEDGELWFAAFPVDANLDQATTIELSVAPDIVIVLRSSDRQADGGTAVAASGASSPMAKNASSRRPSARAQDLERLTTRLAATEAALDRESERRAATEQTLEQQRTEVRQLSAELGRARAELDLARTVQRESEAMAAELDATRRELQAITTRHRQLSDEHERVIDAHAQLQAELQQRSGALESARDAVEQERTRGAVALDQERTRQTEALAQERARGADALSQERTHVTEPGPEPAAAAGVTQNPDSPSRRGRAEQARAEQSHDARHRPVAPHRPDRPINPALNARPNWLGRAMALLVIVGVIVAVWLVLHSTILHH
ncbi:MAG: hypothetical protein ACR2NR_14215 [Solirubrobacteraceae bacterium]